MRSQSSKTNPFLKILVGCCTAALVSADLLSGQVVPIELTPEDVGSVETNIFSTLPTDDPALFGISGTNVQTVNFDDDPFGNPLFAEDFLTDEYESIGVVMNGIRLDTDVYQGPASPPNATEWDAPQIYTFDPPVDVVGIINTSPDNDSVKLYAGPNASGTLLLDFNDQEGMGTNFNIDRFVGGAATSGEVIRSIRIANKSGNLELDELIFRPAQLLLGDVNRDGQVNLLDVDPFIVVVSNGNYFPEADTNEDGSVNLADVASFIALLGA